MKFKIYHLLNFYTILYNISVFFLHIHDMEAGSVIKSSTDPLFCDGAVLPKTCWACDLSFQKGT